MQLKKLQLKTLSLTNLQPESTIREDQLLFVPGLGVSPRTQGERKVWATHRPMDWTGYWVDRMEKELAAKNAPSIMRASFPKVLASFLSLNPGAPSKHGPNALGTYLYQSLESGGAGRRPVLTGSAAQNILAALIFFYASVLKAPKCLTGIPGSIQKWSTLMAQAANEKQKLMLVLVSGFGIKISELVQIKLSDVDAERSQIRIAQNQGKRSKLISVPKSLLESIESYRKLNRPVVYLFESERAGRSMGKTKTQILLEKAETKAGMEVGALIPSIGLDLRFMQAFLGHPEDKRVLVK